MLFWLAMHGADILSSMNMPPWLVEGNIFARDPWTLRFVLWKGLALKAMAFGVYGGIGALLYWMVRQSQPIYARLAAALPFIYSGVDAINVVIPNLLLRFGFHLR